MVELNPVMATHLEAAAAGRYRYQLSQPTFGSQGLALYSRFPIVSADIRPIGSRLGLEAHLDVDGQPVRLFVVHPFPPIFNGRLSAEWAKSLATIGDEATSPGPPTIVVGDFNASRWHPPFRRLLRRGLRDSHEWLGHGFSTSWPNDWRHATVRPPRPRARSVRGSSRPRSTTSTCPAATTGASSSTSP